MYVRGTLPLRRVLLMTIAGIGHTGVECQSPHLPLCAYNSSALTITSVPSENRTAARVPSASTRMEAKRTLGDTSTCSGRPPRRWSVRERFYNGLLQEFPV